MKAKINEQSFKEFEEYVAKKNLGDIYSVVTDYPYEEDSILSLFEEFEVSIAFKCGGITQISVEVQHSKKNFNAFLYYGRNSKSEPMESTQFTTSYLCHYENDPIVTVCVDKVQYNIKYKL